MLIFASSGRLLESKKSGKVEGAGLRCRFAILDGRLQQLDDRANDAMTAAR
jgi:hypothetical protein